MIDVISVRFRQEQVSVFNGNNCPLSAGFSVRNRRNMHIILLKKIIKNITTINISTRRIFLR